LERDFRRIWRIDLLDYVSGGRHWRQFWRFKSALESEPYLGQGSAYLSAWLSDPDNAEAMSRRPVPKHAAHEVPLEGFDKTTENFTDLKDLLIALACSFGGADNPKFSPRPKYLHEKIRDARASEVTQGIFRMMTPHAFEEGN